MSFENTLRNSQTAAVRTGIHLVHSRDWQQQRPLVRPVAFRLAPPPAPRSRVSDITILGAAALTAPLIWLGHALLAGMHLL